MADWANLLTEQRNPRSERIDEVSTLEMLAIINREDAGIAVAVGKALPAVALAVDMVVEALSGDGRLFYLGAGTSGRLGILDASECPPTFRADPEMVQGLIAGGTDAVFQAVEGAEDDPNGAVDDLASRGLSGADVVIGIAASGVTPYVVGGLACARRTGSGTVLLTCSPSAAEAVVADVKIVAEVGPEVIPGSTRMKAGTGTKMILNMITTGAMVRLGKTFGNFMVDLQPTNAKLKDRSMRILSALTALPAEAACALLDAANGELKVALVMKKCQLDVGESRLRLSRYDGRVKAALQAVASTSATVDNDREDAA